MQAIWRGTNEVGGWLGGAWLARGHRVILCLLPLQVRSCSCAAMRMSPGRIRLWTNLSQNACVPTRVLATRSRLGVV